MAESAAVSAGLPRKVLVLGIPIFLALFVGYLLGSGDIVSYMMVAFVMVALTIPLFLESHHFYVILSWNLPLMMFFLPGSPPQWMLITAISLPLTLLGRLLDSNKKLCFAPSVGWSLLALALVVLVTMKQTGAGFGVRSFGASNFGGKKYFFILMAAAGFFAISLARAPLGKAHRYIGALFLPGSAMLMTNLIYMLGPSLWFLYYLFPSDFALGQYFEDYSSGMGGIKFARLGGLTMACIAVFSYLLARYRVSGVLDWRHPWRFLMMTMVVALSLLGGFRTSLACCSILFIIQFILEGLHRTRCVAIFAIVPIIGATILVPFSDKMPLSVQRCLSFLPLKIDSSVRANAEHSTQWRLEMWSILWPEVDKYFWEGKGYTASATDYFLTGEAVRRGYATDHEMMILAGDYHNGALSIIIPFGIWGVIAFLWFLAAGTRVLHLNFRYGDPELKQWNIALYAGFLTKIIVFFFIYGAVHSDMVAMVGLVGLGVSLNGGVCRKPTAQERESERVSMVSQEPVAALPG